MRTAGVLCIVLLGAAAGLTASGRLRRQASSAGKLVSLLSDLAVCIRYQRLPMEELLAAMAERRDYADYSFLRTISSRMEPGISPAELWRSAVRADAAVPDAAAAVLCSLGDVLGTTDLDGQLAALELHGTQLRQTAEQYRTLYQDRGNLYRWLGILGGAMLGLLIL